MEAPPPTTQDRSGTALIVAGSLVAGLGAYLLQVVGGRTLGPDAFVAVSALWTAMFIVSSVLHLPVEQQVTRLVASGIRPALTASSLWANLLAVGAGVGFVLATLDTYFDGDVRYAAQALILFVAAGAAVVRRGELAGMRAFRRYGLATIAQTASMLTIGVALLWRYPTPHSVIWALALAPLANLFLRAPRAPATATGAMHAPGSPTQQPAARRFLGPYILASASSQALLAGGPLVVIAVGGRAQDVSILFVVFTLFRAPLTLLYAVQARVLPNLIRHHLSGDTENLRTFVARVWLVAATLTPLAFALGWVLGPWLVGLLFGAAFRPDPAVAAAIAAGMVLATASHLGGQALVAVGATARLAGAWTLGLSGAAAVVLLAPAEPATRVAIAFLVGETIAVATTAFTATNSFGMPATGSSDRPGS